MEAKEEADKPRNVEPREGPREEGADAVEEREENHSEVEPKEPKDVGPNPRRNVNPNPRRNVGPNPRRHARRGRNVGAEAGGVETSV